MTKIVIKGVNYLEMNWEHFFDLKTVKLMSGPNFKPDKQWDLFFIN